MAKNIELMGAVFPDVPSIKLPQYGGGLVSFDDTSDADAVAGDIAQGKTAYVNGVKVVGTNQGTSPVLDSKSITENGTYTASDEGLDGYSDVTVNVPSPWKFVASQEISVSTTSTSETTAATIQCGPEIATKDKIVWVHIRDTAGPREGYFYGSDEYFANTRKANGETGTYLYPAVEAIRYGKDGKYTSIAGRFGVYAYSMSNEGELDIRRRYNSASSLTIDGTYKVDVYTLDLPDGLSLFE